METPAQAIKALLVNFPGLDKWLTDSEQDGIGYRVKIGREQGTSDTTEVLAMRWSEREVFSITPVIAGAGGVGYGLNDGLSVNNYFFDQSRALVCLCELKGSAWCRLNPSAFTGKIQARAAYGWAYNPISRLNSSAAHRVLVTSAI